MGQKLLMIVCCAMLCLMGTAPALAQDALVFEGPQEDIDAILAVLAEWGRARDAGDVDGVVAVHDEDMQIMTRNRAILKGHDGVRTFYEENYSSGSERQQFGNMAELRVFGDAAFAAGQFLVIDEGQDIEDPDYYMIVMRRNAEGAWKVYRDIDTPSPDGLSLKPSE